MLNCFISAAPGIDITAIKNILHAKGISYSFPAEIPDLGLTLFDKAKELIKSSDLFLAVLGKESANRNTYIEIGIAVGYGKKILIVSASEFAFPSDVWGLVQVTADFERTEAVSFAIDQLVAAPKAEKRRPAMTMKLEPTPLGVKAENFHRTLRNLGALAMPADIERIVADVLRSSGIQVITEAKDSITGPDFAIWSPELSTILGNPILIEVKKSLRRRADIMAVKKQVTQYMSRSNSRYALILYVEGPPSDKVQREAGTYHLLFFRLPDLLESLEDETFFEHVRRRRNEIVHGRVL